MLVVLPFWTSFLIRIYAWINILQHDGLLNQALLALGLVDAPVAWLATDTAVYIGIVYSYLPFMVLPIYATLEKHGRDAARGRRRPRLPALEGVLAGDAAARRSRASSRARCCASSRSSASSSSPTCSAAPRRQMIGQTLWTEFFANRDWPAASAVAVVLLACWSSRSSIYQHLQTRELEGGR